ncbi:hypothetical protein SAMN05444353_2541 [Polaribacter dokdonensis DSW-5]|uniref:Uncharacterized protein n=1 Tax=Polaribacter dokdonensis DSW-5 TaxID=1300348 RepID=A0A1H5K1Z2_9FLAO|nr:hypothetical protein SAMN05444353_2541 [Polaribacter dokdonensis DSW-5]
MQKLRYIILITSIICLIALIPYTGFDPFFTWKNLTPHLILLCLIISNAGSIIYVNKNKKTKNTVE